MNTNSSHKAFDEANSDVKKENIAYWKDKLSNLPTLKLYTESLEYPLKDREDFAQISFQVDNVNDLNSFVISNRTNFRSVFLATITILLFRYTGLEDIAIFNLIGTDSDENSLGELESCKEFVTRNKLNNRNTFLDLVNQAETEIENSLKRLSHITKETIEQINFSKEANQILYCFERLDSENFPVINHNNVQTRTVMGSCRQKKNPLSFLLFENRGNLEITIHYQTQFYSDSLVTRIGNHLKILLKNGILNPLQNIEALVMMSETERHQILVSFNQTATNYPSEKNAIDLFLQQVSLRPQNVAVTFNGINLSYRELNEKSNQLAHYLRNSGSKKNSLIPIFIERSFEMIIGILGILKSGAAYVPIDIEYPNDRVEFIIKDINPEFIVTSSKAFTPLFDLKKLILLDEDWKKISLESRSNVIDFLTPGDLAYLIFTSGSTGKPKGTLIHHGGLVNLATSNVCSIALFPGVRVLQFASCSFDVSVYEILCTLLCGGQLIIPTKEALIDPFSLRYILDFYRVEVIALPPSFLFVIEDDTYYLKTVFSAGEALNAKVSSHLQKKGVKLINAYGPAECSVNATMSDSPILSSGVVTIGKPIDNVKVYILDPLGELVPIGVIGELFIAGAGVGLGYLNRPDLTAERFIANPFRTDAERLQGVNDRLYKTGDLCRWLPDGNIEYIGRNDFQVKIRGFRIELGEIEAALQGCAGVSQCVVLARDHTGSGDQGGSKYLAGYYVSPERLDEAGMLRSLSDHLPEYMVPSILVHLESLPLTINGKLDRKALPDPDFSGDSDSYVAPRTELESRVCEIYAEVLGLSAGKVGIRDDFFRLGGNSLMAIRLISRINSELSLTINVALIFRHRTIESVLHALTHSDAADNVIIARAALDGHYPLSFAQERLWFIEKYEGGSNAYNIPLFFEIKPGVEVSLLERSIVDMAERHEVLRSLIRIDSEGVGYQQVFAQADRPLVIGSKSSAGLSSFHESMKSDANHIFDLSEEYPLRVSIYTLDDGSRYLSMVFHHIAFDGWSIDILLRELGAYYAYNQGLSSGVQLQPGLPELSIQYKDFASWQKAYLSGTRLQEELGYWREKLSGFETLHLPLDKPRPSRIDYSGRYDYFELDDETSVQLRSLAKELKVSLYSLLLSGCYLLLGSYSNQEDIVIGTPVANRNYDQVSELIGFFVNSLVLRTQIDPEQPLSVFIEGVGEEVIHAQLHQDLPFERLVQELDIAPDTSRHPVFQVMFTTENFRGLNEYAQNIIEHYELRDIYQVARFDLTVIIDDSRNYLKGAFNYADKLFSAETIKSMMATYVFILKQFASSGSDIISNQSKISGIKYVSPEWAAEQLTGWNDTGRYYDTGGTIHGMFSSQVLRSPEAVALIYGDVRLSYRELNERSNQLAHYLLEHYSIVAGDLVALCQDRSEDMLISILGVLKSGGAYVPMDPGYPVERIGYIIGDTGCRVVLSGESYVPLVSSVSGSAGVIGVDGRVFKSEVSGYPVTDPRTQTSGSDLAYVIYTSGTTGQPKGVMIEHKGIINRIGWMNHEYPLEAGDRILQKTPYVFDVSVWELFWANWYGAAIVMARPDGHKEPDYLISEIRREGVSVIHFVPSMLSVFEDQLSYQSAESSDWAGLPSLRYIFCSGEALNLTQVKRAHSLLPGAALHNLYGPTEASVDVLYSSCTSSDISMISIGRPIWNTQVYILDGQHSVLPVGAVGELYIGGAGLSRGYLNRPDLTAERFIANPFRTDAERLQGVNDRLYKTGDLCRWLPDGNIEYIGRNDFQVKIRGFRIELGEIEAALQGCAGVSQCVVLARDHTGSGDQGGSKYLAGYYVSPERLDEAGMLRSLSDHLPEYMVPSILVHLESLPLTINGKLDRKALPDPDFSGDSDSYVAPRTELESRVCEIYAEVLGLSAGKVGIRDDFFRLGGDSIVSIQVVSRLRKRLGVNVNVKDIFTYRSIGLLCDNVIIKNIAGQDKERLSEQGVLSGGLGLLPVQSWFFSRGFERINHWNQSFMIRVPELDPVLLQASLDMLSEYHDALRLRYSLDDAEQLTAGYMQYYTGIASSGELKLLDIGSLSAVEGDTGFDAELQELLTGYQSRFDLISGPLYQVVYITGYTDGSCRIFFALHHLIVDTVSWRILRDDLQSIYTALSENKAQLDLSVVSILGAKGSSYRQWIKAVAAYGPGHDSEIGYWSSVMRDYGLSNSVLERYKADGSGGSNAQIRFDKATTRRLLTESSHAYHTEINDLLLTAFGLAYASLTGSDFLHLTLEGHGREDIDDRLDIGHTAGWFTTMFPARLAVRPEDIGQSIKQVKESLRSIPNKGIGYGPLVGYREQELPGIVFNYLGQFDREESAGGNQGDWSITGEGSGTGIHADNSDGNMITFNGYVIDGILRFSISTGMNQQDTGELAQTFENKLIEICEYTSGQSRSYLTVSDVNKIISQDYLDALQKDKDIVDVYLANSLQQGFIYHWLNQGEVDDAYQVQLIWDYHTEIDVEKLQQAWKYTQAKFPSLRIRLAWDDQLVQIIDADEKLDWNFQDISFLDNDKKRAGISDIKDQDRLKKFNLKDGNLLRINLIKQNSKYYTCIFCYHHAILDGWSNHIILSYLHRCYSHLLVNTLFVDTAPDNAYGNTQLYLQKHAGTVDKYWKQYISNIDKHEDLSGLIKPDVTQINIFEYKHVFEPAEQNIRIDGKKFLNLKNIGVSNGITLNAILQYVWHKTLSIYGNTHTTSVGTTLSGRSLPIDNIEHTAGLFINTLPIIFKHNSGGTILESIQTLQSDINEANSRSNVNLSELQKNGDRIFSSLFVYENYPSSITSEAINDFGIHYVGAVEKLDYPLSIIVFEQKDTVIIKLSYAGEIFSFHSIHSLFLTFSNILDQIIENQFIQVDHLNGYPNGFAEQLTGWNDTGRYYDTGGTIHGMFSSQVLRSPEAVALIYGDVRLSYRELNERSNQLAHYLLEHYSIVAGDLVALCQDRSEDMLISILGVLKSGGAYVPMDPGYPVERIGYIIGDTGCRVVLSGESYVPLVSSVSGSAGVIGVDGRVFKSEVSGYPVTDPRTQTSGSDLAYVIYTSGTTGQPKGVMIEHKGVVNTISSLEHVYDFNKGKRVSAFTAYVFDVCVTEFFTPLLHGAELYLLSEATRLDTDLISIYLLENKINYVYLPPVLLSTLPRVSYPDLCGIVYAGEPCDKETGKYWSGYTNLYNYYGPTEATIYATGKQIINGDVSSIGRPIWNTQVYILDGQHSVLPVGAVGELYIGGAGLSRGYLNRPDLTAERFIANPFRTDAERLQGVNDRLYKTGDLCRWLPDGNIEYIGRNDFQVKIRGFRIELGEIEAALQGCAGVSQCVVLARDHTGSGDQGGSKYLAGYYVSPERLDEAGMLRSLSDHLPEYMVPSILVHLESLPLTINGKLDRKALPDPDFSGDSDSYVAPRTELESRVCEIYAEVLGLSAGKVGMRDNFFRLGGNSIMAIRLISKINRKLSLSVSVSVVFKHRSIGDLVQALLQPEAEKVVISRTALSDHYPLSFAQERLWFIEKYEGGSNAYNIPLFFEIKPGVEVSLLERSIVDMAERHEVLRSLIRIDSEGVGYQQVFAQADRPLVIGSKSSAGLSSFHESMKSDANHIFDLSEEYPLRVSIYTLDDGSRYLSMVFHHIAFDGWSIDILLRELGAYYAYNQGLSSGVQLQPGLPELSIQYKDFASWQKAYLSGTRLQEELGYWREKLSGFETLHLPLDKPRPSRIDYSGDQVYFELDSQVSGQLRLLARELKVSLFSVLLSGYYLLLKSYSNQEDIVIGTPVANRNYDQVSELIGFFVNSLVLRTQIDPEQPLSVFIEGVGEEVIHAQLHQDLPFERLVQELDIAPDTSRHPVFQVMFTTENFGELNEQASGLLTPYALPEAYRVAKFDLTAVVDDSGEFLKGAFNYATSLFNKETIENLVYTYKIILEQLGARPGIAVKSLNYLDGPAFDHIVTGWNDTGRYYDTGGTIHGMFSSQVLRSPEAVALIYGDVRLSYRELNERSNQLAHYLLEHYSIVAGDLVALCQDRSEDMLISILGVLKSGGAYVPMDPGYPVERIGYIIGDTGCRVVLSGESYVPLVSSVSGSAGVIGVDGRVFKSEVSGYPVTDPRTQTSGSDLAYVIYTSGTTGQPKGVMIEHKSLRARIQYLQENYNLTSADNLIFYRSYCFDAAIEEYLLPLLIGAKCFITPLNFKENLVNNIIEYVAKNKITKINMPPVLLEEFVEFADESTLEKLSPLRHIVSGGDKLSVKIVNEYLALFNATLNNAYGPSENTDDSTTWKAVHLESSLRVPIGKPIQNSQAYILDKYLKPVPIGACGELHVSGAGLSRGYLNLEELTNQKFIQHPFIINDRLYKTGDLCRWLPDGNIEYIGRNDFQVKIRGFRIELGEIEAALQGCAGVSQCVVLARDHTGSGDQGGSKYLAGYYVSPERLDEAGMLRSLSDHLPEYMVPSILVHLESLPLTINGKLDRKALPDPDFSGDSDSYVAPRTELESRVCEIYAEVLGLSAGKVGMRDNFFRLGGNSIMAIRLISKINRKLSLSVSVSVVFKHRSIGDLVQALLQPEAEKVVISRTALSDHYPLSFAQERLWFIEKYEGGSNAYNIPLFFEIKPGVEVSLLERSIVDMAERHEVLRSLIRIDSEGVGYQQVFAQADRPLVIGSKSSAGLSSFHESMKSDANHIFDLSEEYPLRVSIYTLDDGSRYLSMVFHHIAFDGWSIDILLRELGAYYAYNQGLSSGVQLQPGLPELSIQYKDFASWQKAYLSGTRLQEELGYWREKLSGFETLHLPLDKPRPSRIDYSGDQVYFELDSQVSGQLRLLARELKVSLFSVLLSGYYLLLKSYSNQEDIVIGTPVANRNYDQVSELIGFFVNSLVLRTQIDPEQPLSVFIEGVGEEVIHAQLHQDLPFERLVQELDIAPDTSRHPVFQVMFTTENFGELNEQASGLLTPYALPEAYRVAKFDLTAVVDDSGEFLKGAFNYATSLFNKETIENLVYTYKIILEQLGARPGIAVKSLNYLDGPAFDHIVTGWNDTGRYYDTGGTIHGMFSSQVLRSPEAVALIYGDVRLSYRELNERSNQLAHYLLEHYSIVAGDLVALCQDRSEDMLISILGVLKSGGAYVPMDPGYPVERIGYIIGDTGCRVVLSGESYVPLVSSVSGSAGVIGVDGRVFKSEVSGYPVTDPRTQTSGSDLAYVIYTSGTTGQPKGVMIEHKGIINRIGWMNHEYPLEAGDRILQKTPYVFDVSVWELFWANWYGAAIVMARPDGHKEPDYLISEIRREGVSVIHFVPSMLSVFEDQLSYQSAESSDWAGLPSLRYIFCSGEALNLTQVKRAHSLLPGAALHNLYGPTEASVDVLYSSCTSSDISMISIGRPIWNTQVYILDGQHSVLPVGAVGELYIGGAGLSRGYLNRPDLTAERFIANPFRTDAERLQGVNDRLYKTGDLCRWLPDGNIEYIGRNDFQVKIRGFRIELGEIEAALQGCAGVSQCVVLARDHTGSGDQGGSKYLAGYYVSPERLDEAGMLRSLSDHLPEYMVPSILVHLESLPLTINGKLDRKALPDPDFSGDSDSYVAPRTELESRVCEIYAEVLGLSAGKVGIRDDFFRLGGDSLMAIRLISRINSELVQKISVRDIFEKSIIENLCQIFSSSDIEDFSDDDYQPFSLIN